jgi:Na+/pantothenate symporter
MTERQTVRGIRIGIVCFGIACICGTYLWADGIANAWYYLGGFMFSMFFIPIIAGLFYKRKTGAGGLACIVYSALMYVVWEFVLACPGGIPTSVFITITGAIVYFVVCNLTYKGGAAPSEEISAHGG